MVVWRIYCGGPGGFAAAVKAENNLNRRGGMNIDIIFRIAGIGLLISVLCIVLKQAQKQEQAEMLTLAGVVVVLIIVVQLMNQLFTVVRSVFNL
jgi:stage III sporulation protein AC